MIVASAQNYLQDMAFSMMSVIVALSTLLVWALEAFLDTAVSVMKAAIGDRWRWRLLVWRGVRCVLRGVSLSSHSIHRVGNLLMWVAVY